VVFIESCLSTKPENKEENDVVQTKLSHH
jgi:hypothetical protein